MPAGSLLGFSESSFDYAALRYIMRLSRRRGGSRLSYIIFLFSHNIIFAEVPTSDVQDGLFAFYLVNRVIKSKKQKAAVGKRYVPLETRKHSTRAVVFVVGKRGFRKCPSVDKKQA